jgi:hypothetical protein
VRPITLWLKDGHIFEEFVELDILLGQRSDQIVTMHARKRQDRLCNNSIRTSEAVIDAMVGFPDSIPDPGSDKTQDAQYGAIVLCESRRIPLGGLFREDREILNAPIPYYYLQWPYACLMTLRLPEPFRRNALSSVEREEMIYGNCGWSLR